jgi:hypothetical protein
MTTRLYAIPLALVALALVAFAAVVLAENVDPNNNYSQFAWAENAGWLNVEPADPSLTNSSPLHTLASIQREGAAMLIDRIQNKFAWVLLTVVTLILVATLAGVVRGGPLDPPGPVAPTGKTVIPSLPYTISQQGSYVLNGNLTGVVGQDGITISASNVTIDLQGFEISGGGSSGYAITGLPLNPANVAVRNGTIRNWDGGQAVRLGDGAVVDDLRVYASASGLGGIVLGNNSRLSNCHVEGYTNIASGISVGTDSIVDNCVSTRNQTGITAADGVTILNSTVTGSTGVEINAGARATIENCNVDGKGTLGNGIVVGANSIIRGCTVRNNGGVEILAGASSTVESCSADGAAGVGIGIQVGQDSVVRGCTATNNGDDEIVAGDGSLIEDCVVDGFTGPGAGPGDGIQVANETTIRGCNVRWNSADGIRVTGQLNRIESNRSYNNGDSGFRVLGGGNVGIQNTAGFNTDGNYAITVGNNFEVITGTAGATNPFANVQ